jgi:hypothetical protein
VTTAKKASTRKARRIEGRKSARQIAKEIDGLPRLPGVLTLREKVRLLDKGSRLLCISPIDAIEALGEIDELRLRVARGKVGAVVRLEGIPTEEKDAKLTRYHPKVVELVEAFARNAGGRQPWSFNETVNAILAAVLS